MSCCTCTCTTIDPNCPMFTRGEHSGTPLRVATILPPPPESEPEEPRRRAIWIPAARGSDSRASAYDAPPVVSSIVGRPGPPMRVIPMPLLLGWFVLACTLVVIPLLFIAFTLKNR